jgi:hypothetical protein
MRIGNHVVGWLLRSPFHPLLGPAFALITVWGRRSGREYTTPVNVLCSNENFSIVSYRHRTWWRNLRGGGEAELIYAGERLRCSGQVLEALQDVVVGLREHFSISPDMARHFGIQIQNGADIRHADLERVAAERVVIQLRCRRRASVRED